MSYLKHHGSLTSPTPLGEVTRNIGTMLLSGRERRGDGPAFAQRVSGEYRYWSWNELVDDVLRFASFLQLKGLRSGDRCAFVSANSYKRLVCELAVMASGMVSVPIFAGYSRELISQLVSFSKVKALVVEDTDLAEALRSEHPPELVVALCDLRQILDTVPAATPRMDEVFRSVDPSTLTMIMFTSGTSGFPKGVQLTHLNLMSQQRALEILWKPETGMRFLCYLPWHHSFGGLFERFFALHSGGCLAIDDSCGKAVDRLLRNFGEIKPNVYFSVPKVYQEIISRVLGDKSVERSFFHPDLKFVFTAAAPLPLSTSAVFKAHDVPVVEGWGLTETSPCCTLTGFSLDREPGVVGLPLPGVEIKLEDDGEIVVRGPNVMTGYLDQPEATAEVMDADGWLKTGDLGMITPLGVRILSRKDRMFKLSNGEKVFPSVIEESLRARCKFVKHAYVFGKGQSHPVALVFPNRDMFLAGVSSSTDSLGCEHPGCERDLSLCLARCISNLNSQTKVRFECIQKAVVVCAEPSIESGELTPSFKLIPRAIERKYESYIRLMEEGRFDTLPDDAYIVELAIGGSEKE